jgi:hypothetical protein
MRLHLFGRFIGFFRLLTVLAVASPLVSGHAFAQQDSGQYTMQEIVDAGHSFFGSTSGGLAKVVESAFQKYGLPNGYILGQEGGGEHPLYWQGPSLGIDYGGQGSRVMMLVYDLPSIDAIYARFGGVSGSAYVVAGFGMTLLKNNNVLVVPIRTGLGARLGINVGYLKLTQAPTWNPF